jgi:hypothetical protein
MKTLYISIVLILFAGKGYSQDTSQYKVLPKVNVHKNIHDSSEASMVHFKNQPSVIYRDTRLGSSSPLYNTYQKNNFGAGAITTNPNKSEGPSFIYSSPAKPDTIKNVPDSLSHH